MPILRPIDTCVNDPNTTTLYYVGPTFQTLPFGTSLEPYQLFMHGVAHHAASNTMASHKRVFFGCERPFDLIMAKALDMAKNLVPDDDPAYDLTTVLVLPYPNVDQNWAELPDNDKDLFRRMLDTVDEVYCVAGSKAEYQTLCQHTANPLADAMAKLTTICVPCLNIDDGLDPVPKTNTAVCAFVANKGHRHTVQPLFYKMHPHAITMARLDKYP